MYEEFVADGERSVEVGLKELLAVPYEAAPDSGVLRAVFARLEALRAEPDAPVAKADLVEAIRAVVPTLQHVDSEHSLDRKM
jgi:hypothetical protein